MHLFDKEISPVVYAAAHGHEDVVQILLKKNDATRDMHRGVLQDALYCAVKKRRQSTVKLLITRRSNELFVMKDVIRENDIEALSFLLDNSITPDASFRKCSKKTSALMEATRCGKQEAVELLLVRGALLSQRDENYKSALYWAARRNDDCLVKLFLDKGDSNGESVLVEMAEEGSMFGALILIKNGVNINRALVSAAQGSSVVALKKLIEFGADPNATCRDLSALSAAILWCDGEEEAVKFLVESGASVSATDKDGRSPLFFAARRKMGSVVDLLLKNRADSSSVLNRLRELGDSDSLNMLTERLAAAQNTLHHYNMLQT
jgi:ankyrin repeat protein